MVLAALGNVKSQAFTRRNSTKCLKKQRKKSIIYAQVCPCCKTGNLHRIAVLTSVVRLLGIVAVDKTKSL
jgi:hypothetical protein